jgi:hypothetical protein
MMRIPVNKPTITEREIAYVTDALQMVGEIIVMTILTASPRY